MLERGDAASQERGEYGFVLHGEGQARVVDGPLAESKGKASPFAHFELPDRIEWDAKDVTLVIWEEFNDMVLDAHG